MTETQTYADSVPAIDPDARLQQIREAFVDDALRGLVWLSLSILAISFWRNFLGPVALRWHEAFAVVVVSTLLMLATFLNRRRLSFRFKATALVSVLFLTGAGGLLTFGQAAPTGNYFAMGFFISAILFSRSTVFLMIAGVAALIACIAYSVIRGMREVTVNLNAVTLQPAVWINLTMTLALSAGTIATAMGSFIRSVQLLLSDVHRQQVQIKHQHDQIRHLATHDNLTGLPILALATDRSNVAIAHARRTGQKIAFMFIDLDGFKGINDQYGHDAGDCVLKEVAHRLRTTIREADTAARIGGDEFVIILTDLVQAHFAGQIASKILQTISAPITYDGQRLSVGASIGIAIFPDHADNLDALKKGADKAMYAVKASGKNTYSFAQSADPRQTSSFADSR